MTPSPVAVVRDVIPRWRSLKRTVEARELSFPPRSGTYKQVSPHSDDFRARIGAWRLSPGVLSAAELVEVAMIEGDDAEAIAPARALVEGSLSPTDLVRDQALRLLERRRQIECRNVPVLETLEQRLSYWRRRTRFYPSDPLSWVELARLQTCLGLQEKAKRSMLVARQIAPTNRHVIRSAARMFVHLHEPDIAHQILRKCDATPFDPWLTAAEIAVASQRRKSPRFFNSGLSLVNSGNWQPHQVNELAAAVGTTFLRDGNHKRGRRMMMQGLADPTGNTLAQAEWVTVAFRETLLGASKLNMSNDANEARSLRYYRIGLFEKSLESAVEWIDEEPFSIRAHACAVAAASAAQDYGTALSLAKCGLRFDPECLPILQNKAFALACSGELSEAEQVLDRIPSQEGAGAYVMEANRGLIAFRRGQMDRGREHYMIAVAGFRRSNELDNERNALAYFAREAVRAELHDAEGILREATEKLGDSETLQARRVLTGARVMLEAQRGARVAARRRDP